LRFKNYFLPFIVLGTSFLNSSKVEAALRTHPLSYERRNGTSETLTGTLIIDDAGSITFGNFITDSGGLPSWINTLDMTYTDSSGTATNYTKTDFAALRFVKNVDSVNYTTDLVPQFTKIQFIAAGDGPSGGGGTNFQMDMDEAEFELTATPSPLPLMAFLPFIYFVKKIKRNLKPQ